MKISAKKLLSLLLAVVMILSAVTVALAAPKAGSLEIRTEILKEIDGSLTAVETVKNGDTVKVRVYIGTDYPTNSGGLLLYYDSDFFEADYEEDALQELNANDDYPSLSGMNISAAFHSAESSAVSRMVDYGFISEDDVQNYKFIKINYSFPLSAGSTSLDADEWITEFELKVKGNAPEKSSTIKALDSALMTPESPKGIINIPVGEEGGYVGDVASLSEYDVDFTNTGATVDNYKEYKLSFNVNGGTPIDPVYLRKGESYTLPLPEKEGYKFVYWSFNGGLYAAGDSVIMPEGDATASVMWLVKSHTVKYYVGGEEFNFDVTVGSELPKPDLSDIEGLEILYWLDESGNKTELPAKMPDNSLSFTAVVKYNFDSEGGITADFDGGIFGSNENSISFKAESKSFSAESGGVDFGGENYKQIAKCEIGFENNGVSVNPTNGKATISIPVPEKYAGRTDFVLMRNGKEKVDFTVSDGKIIFSADKFGVFDIYIKSGTSIKTLPSKTRYYYKENLDISGLELEITAENGEKIIVTDTSKMKVTGFDSKKIGNQKLTVEYDGTSATFNVVVSYAWWQTIIRIFLLGFLWY